MDWNCRPRKTVSIAFVRSSVTRDLTTYPHAPMSNAAFMKSVHSCIVKKIIFAGQLIRFRRLATSKPLRSPKEISKITISGLRIGILSRAEAPSENAAATSYFVRNIFKMAVEKAGLSSTNTRIGDATTFGAISDTYVAWACARLNIIGSRNSALLAKVSANQVRI